MKRSFYEIDGAVEKELLVSFFDLSNFGRFARGRSDHDLSRIMQQYYEYSGEIVENSGGKIVKFIGDGGIAAFGGQDAEAGVLSLRRLKEEGDRWFFERGGPCSHRIKAHYGPVICVRAGTQSDKRFDVFGQTVNTAATVETNGFAITAQVFRKLSPQTRRLFKKHTPPITYIPVDEPHRR